MSLMEASTHSLFPTPSLPPQLGKNATLGQLSATLERNHYAIIVDKQTKGVHACILPYNTVYLCVVCGVVCGVCGVCDVWCVVCVVCGVWCV